MSAASEPADAPGRPRTERADPPRRRAADLRPPPRARAARRLAGDGRRHPADARLHRGQLRSAACGPASGPRSAPPCWSSCSGWSGGRACSRRSAACSPSASRWPSRPRPGRPATSSCSASSATPRIGRGPAGVDRPAPAAGRRHRRVPRPQPPGRDGLALAARAAQPHRPGPREPAPDREPAIDPDTGVRDADPEPERHWRDDPRMLRAYSWLTVLWGGHVPAARARPGPAVPGRRGGAARARRPWCSACRSPAVEVVVTLWVVVPPAPAPLPGPEPA